MIFTKLSNQQRFFTKLLAQFILWIDGQGYSCALREVQRTQLQADYNAKHGLGISKSLHLESLAVDLMIWSKEGLLLDDKAMMQKFGDKWENMSSLNRWGGNFSSMFDGNHFEMKKAVQ